MLLRSGRWNVRGGGVVCASAFLFFLLISGFSPLNAVEILPIYNFQLSGGQYYFEGEESSFSGNSSLLASPVLRFNERWALLPIYTGAYRGTKQVQDLVGGGTLFQELQDHRVAAKALYTPVADWRFKGDLGFTMELLKETKDEEWFEGLFDYYKPGFGLEAEYLYQEPFSLRTRYDFYILHFPNYESLESQAGVDAEAGSLSRELAGEDVLNSLNHSLTLAGSLELPRRMILELELASVLRAFPDQQVVLETGELSGESRRDSLHLTNAGLRLPLVALSRNWSLAGDFSYSFLWNRSNQDSYDAQRTQFIESYYDYFQHRLGPSFQFFYGPPKEAMVFGLSGWVGYRDYTDRLVQDAEGTYGTDAIHVLESSVALRFSYPIAPRFRLQVSSELGWSSSNMDYEKLYRYNFSTANYLMGFSYEY
ncbi:MAG: hypothetical protein HY402_01080 [Elusimicrobia bacterium]|nr:hypothetical protein [Elusimicrobiota bacterium]